ncbi:MAG: DNA-binding response regulator [SAR116 cluster bacterium]|nr:DNA-binding response regulator [SAR116 cluster bacterium]
MHILVIDDDDRLRELLKAFLKKNKFKVSTSANAKNAKKLIKEFAFDLIILDVMMPDETGLELLQNFGNEFSTPVLLLTALDQKNDRINGLKSGADDYLTKPFDPEELLLRINNILKRTNFLNKQKIENLRFGLFDWDNNQKKLNKNDQYIHTTNFENDLLTALTDNQGEYLDRTELSKLLKVNSNSRSIDVGITRLRKKIEENPGRPQFLINARGKGWLLRGVPFKN